MRNLHTISLSDEVLSQLWWTTDRSHLRAKIDETGKVRRLLSPNGSVWRYYKLWETRNILETWNNTGRPLPIMDMIIK